jgi:uncharacterized protein YjbI with pentapeptide repeats
LYGTDLSDAILYEGSFVEAMMDKAVLIEVDATRANFSGASLRGVQGISAEFMYANFSRANLSESNFYDADLQETNLEGANFRHANLRKAYLVNAHLAHAVLTGVQVEQTAFIGARGMETIEVEWIEVGSEEAPRRLEGEEAKRWLLKAVHERVRWEIAS